MPLITSYAVNYRWTAMNNSTKWKRGYWLIFEVIMAFFISQVVIIWISAYIRPNMDWDQFYARLGSDALTLTGFVLTSLAVIAKQIDHPAFDEIRIDEGFKDLWRTFTLTACIFLSTALLIRLMELLYFPELSFQSAILVAAIRFLVVLGIMLLFTCILLLASVISIINENRTIELQNEAETPKPIGT